MKRSPPRLPAQPIFNPVCNEEYAVQIASWWNTRGGEVGYVTRFEVRSDFLPTYEVQIVGSKVHAECWIPAEDLDGFNDAIVGEIEIVGKYASRGLPSPWAILRGRPERRGSSRRRMGKRPKSPTLSVAPCSLTRG
jgi:hypothetical protein